MRHRCISLASRSRLTSAPSLDGLIGELNQNYVDDGAVSLLLSGLAELPCLLWAPLNVLSLTVIHQGDTSEGSYFPHTVARR